MMRSSDKTLKREVAIGGLLFWAGMTVWGVYEDGAATAANGMSVIVWAFATAAFGADAVAKQIMPMMMREAQE